uniref:Uncharacterized protein n=1 Tax=Anguilla anguilla TaxID=7936 RepID=A0A0E9UNQ2_ANGAN
MHQQPPLAKQPSTIPPVDLHAKCLLSAHVHFTTSASPTRKPQCDKEPRA